ncbi:MAG: Spy/CpxP family protein refolding chaperone [Campylobacterales bacterium]
MFKKIILATALTAAMSISAFASCEGGMGKGMGAGYNDGCKMEKGKKGGKGGACGEMGKHMMSLSTVKLSAEQKTKIDAINEEFRSEMAKLHIKDKPMMKDPFAVAGGFNKEAFKKERIEKMQKFIEMRAEHLAKIWAVLTPEQQKSIAALAK